MTSCEGEAASVDAQCQADSTQALTSCLQAYVAKAVMFHIVHVCSFGCLRLTPGEGEAAGIDAQRQGDGTQGLGDGLLACNCRQGAEEGGGEDAH